MNRPTPYGYGCVHFGGGEDGSAGVGTTRQNVSWKEFWGTMLWSSTGGKNLKLPLKCGSFLSYFSHVMCSIPCGVVLASLWSMGVAFKNSLRRPYDEYWYVRVVDTWVVCPRDDEH